MIAVILYLYHVDLWDEFKTLLLPFQKDIKLYLGLSSKQQSKNIETEAKNIFDSTVTYHDNYGADVAPFLNQLSLVNTKYFIKIHSKKSLYGAYNQINWRKILLYDLLGSKNLFYNNLKKISQNSKIGIIGIKNLLLNNNENTHSIKIQTLCDLIHWEYNQIKSKSFFGGNMFLSRTGLFQQYFLPYKNELLDLLKNEKGKVDETLDGTYSHSLERLFGYVVSLNNLKFSCVSNPTIKILNDKAPKGKFHLVKLYGNDCYLIEDINVYGNILSENNDSLVIRWLHLENNPIQKYKKINKYTIIQSPT